MMQHRLIGTGKNVRLWLRKLGELIWRVCLRHDCWFKVIFTEKLMFSPWIPSWFWSWYCVGCLKKLCEKRRGKGGKSRQMKKIVKIYERFSESKQSRQRASDVETPLWTSKWSWKREQQQPYKNHKSFPIKYQLVGVFYLLLLDTLSSRRASVAAQACRQKRRWEARRDCTQMLCTWHLKWALNGIHALWCTSLTVKPLNQM